MIYLPILGELFISHRIEFLLFGLVLALLIGMNTKTRKEALYGFAVSLAVYIVSELLSNVHTNYLIEMILLLVGTIALGGIIGFLMVIVILTIRG